MWLKGKQPTHHPVGEWIEQNEIQICVHEAFESELIIQKQPQRVLYINVEYRNGSDKPFNYKLSQWTLLDVDGYSYNWEMISVYYDPWQFKRVRESTLLPYNIARGWVAFKMGSNTKPNLIHFQEHYGHKAINLDFAIDRTQLPFKKCPSP